MLQLPRLRLVEVQIFQWDGSKLTTRFRKFWPRKVFEEVQNHVLESLRKFGPLYFFSKWTKVVDLNSLKVDQRCFLDQNRICEVSPTCNSELLRILFWTQINDKEKYFVVSFEPVKSTGSPKWDLTPQNIWLSDSIPETALLKFKENPGKFLDSLFRSSFDAENVLKQSKLHFTGTNFIFANPYHMDPMVSCHWEPDHINYIIGSILYDYKCLRGLQSLKSQSRSEFVCEFIHGYSCFRSPC